MYKFFLLGIIAACLIYFVLLRIRNRAIYLRYHASAAKRQKFLARMTELTSNNVLSTKVQTSDKLLLDTIYLHNPEKSCCVMYIHSCQGDMTTKADMIEFLYNYASVVCFDFRSYGMSSSHTKTLRERDLNVDVTTIWNWIRDYLGYSAAETVILGESIACGLAINLASKLSQTMLSENYPRALILNSPIYSMRAYLADNFRKIHLSSIGAIIAKIYGTDYKSHQEIVYVNCLTHVLIGHSPRDEIISYRHSLALYQKWQLYHPMVELIDLAGTHNNLILTRDYIYRLTDLLDD